MYRAFYGLKYKPFQISSDPAFLWLGPKHKEALATLVYGVRDNKGFLVLSGGVGTGKTTLIRALLNRLDQTVVPAVVPDPGLESIEFFNFIGRAYGLRGRYTRKVDFLFAFEAFLRKTHTAGRSVLLIIDEAQRIRPSMLEEIRLLSNIETPEQKLLNVFFIGQEEFLPILQQQRHRALRQRITIHFNLDRLSPDETAQLIAHRLAVAGARQPIFQPEAIAEIHRLAQGAPRRINVICDHALLTGFVREAKTIDAAIVVESAEELDLPGEGGKPISAEPDLARRPLNAPARLGSRMLDRPPTPLSSWRMPAMGLAAAGLLGLAAAFFWWGSSLRQTMPPPAAQEEVLPPSTAPAAANAAAPAARPASDAAPDAITAPATPSPAAVTVRPRAPQAPPAPVDAAPQPTAIKVSNVIQKPPQTQPAKAAPASAPRSTPRTTIADRPPPSVAAVPAATPPLSRAPKPAGSPRTPHSYAAPAAPATPLPVAAAPAPAPKQVPPPPAAAAAALSPTAPPVLSARLQDFLDAYCLAYSRKDLETFTRLFAADAVEQDRPFQELLPTYRQNFQRLAALDYRIALQDYAREAAQSLVRLQGRFTMRYRLNGQDWQEARGSIFMDLWEVDGGFRVQRLDYTKE